MKPGGVMSIIEKIKPQFWETDSGTGPTKSLFDYRRIWRKAIAVLALVALVPLCVLAFIDYNVTRRSLESENLLRTARTTSNARRTVAYFLEERTRALDFLAEHQGIARLMDRNNFAKVLSSLKSSFGGFVDIGIIDNRGRQVAYIGPHDLLGVDYSNQDWFENTLSKGTYVSNVFLGFRFTPHLVVARKVYDAKTDKVYILRGHAGHRTVQRHADLPRPAGRRRRFSGEPGRDHTDAVQEPWRTAAACGSGGHSRVFREGRASGRRDPWTGRDSPWATPTCAAPPS